MRRPRADSPPVHEDRFLVKRILRGDRQAFDRFLDDHLPGLYRFAGARVRNTDLAREIVQTALVKAIASLKTYRGEASLAAWLYTICRNEIRAHYKRTKRRPAEAELVEELPEVQAALDSLSMVRDDPEQDLHAKEVADLVHTTLDHLPPRYGRALEWKYIDGLSVKEIADRLEVGPKAAESVLTRAREAFRDGFASASREPLIAWNAGTS